MVSPRPALSVLPYNIRDVLGKASNCPTCGLAQNSTGLDSSKTCSSHDRSHSISAISNNAPSSSRDTQKQYERPPTRRNRKPRPCARQPVSEIHQTHVQDHGTTRDSYSGQSQADPALSPSPEASSCPRTNPFPSPGAYRGDVNDATKTQKPGWRRWPRPAPTVDAESPHLPDHRLREVAQVRVLPVRRMLGLQGLLLLLQQTRAFRYRSGLDGRRRMIRRKLGLLWRRGGFHREVVAVAAGGSRRNRNVPLDAS